MDFMIEEKQFDVDFLKIENSIDTLVSKVICEHASLIENSDFEIYLESSFDNFKEKIIELIKKSIEIIRDFAKKIKVKIDSKIQQMQLNHKLTELKNLLATKRAKAMGKKFNMIDIAKYKKYYKNFINKYVAEVKRGLNKEFTSVEDFERWKTQMSNKLSEFKYTLTDSERWRLSLAVNDAIKLTEDEVKNRDNNINTIEKDGRDVLQAINDGFVNDEFGRSVLDLNDRKYSIFKKKHGFLSFVISKISSCFKTIFTFITKHTFACVTGLLVLLIAL